MLAGKLPIHLNGETRHPAALVTCSLRGRAVCAGLCSPPGTATGDTGVSQRCRRRTAAAGSWEAMQGRGRAEARHTAGPEDGRGPCASPPGHRQPGHRIAHPVCRGAAGAAEPGKSPAASGWQKRRSRSLGRRWKRSLRPGAAEYLSRAASPPPLPAPGCVPPPRVECPRGRPRRAGAGSAWANTRPDKHPDPAGAAVTEGPRRVMHGRRAAAR